MTEAIGALGLRLYPAVKLFGLHAAAPDRKPGSSIKEGVDAAALPASPEDFFLPSVGL